MWEQCMGSDMGLPIIKGVENVAISLFSGGSIGDLGIVHGCGIKMIVACEKNADRRKLIEGNFSDTETFGDINKEKNDIIKFVKNKLKGKRPLLISLSPPCQGMSTTGLGKIRNEMKAGRRPKLDPRNKLILPGLEIIEKLQPEFFVIENVSNMVNTGIEYKGEIKKIIDIIKLKHVENGKYVVRSSQIQFSRYGVPHKRKRLITIGTRNKEMKKLENEAQLFTKQLSSFHAPYSHGPRQNNIPEVVLRDVICEMPPLNPKYSRQKRDDPLHIIPEMNEGHYKWMKNCTEGNSAWYNNKCVNPKCKFDGNENEHVYCKKCNYLLPKPTGEICLKCHKDKLRTQKCPHTIKKGDKKYRLIKGRKTTYKRMKMDVVAPTIIMNSGVVSSDNNVHPTQTRVLSIKEIMMLTTIDNWGKEKYPWAGKYSFYDLETDKKHLSQCKSVPRDVIGESIPPLAMQKIITHILSILNN